LDLG
jgi:hypothetical protein